MKNYNKNSKIKISFSLIGGIDDEVVEEYYVTKEAWLFNHAIRWFTKAKDLEQLIKESMKWWKKRDIAFKQIKGICALFWNFILGGKADLTEVYGEVKLNKEGEEEMEEDLSEVWKNQRNNWIKKKTKMLIGIEVTACLG